MKAILWTKYGSPDFLQVGETEKPTPTEDEILVRVQGATVMPGDCEIRRFDIHPLFWLPLRLYMGIFKPRRPILGLEVSGIIEQVGSNVEDFKVGDEIMAATDLKLGAHAEYVCLNKKCAMSLKPSNVSFEDAATVPTSGLNALHYLRKGEIKPGAKVLIKGAAGCFGTYAVQIAKHLGAEVTGVDHGDKLQVLHELGVDHVIDYTKEDYTRNKGQYDVIFDVVGKSSITKGMQALKADGKYILANPWIKRVFQGWWSAATSKRKFIFALAPYKNEDLDYLRELIESNTIKPIVDRSYRLEEIKEAHKYVEAGKKIGNVTISVRSFSLF